MQENLFIGVLYEKQESKHCMKELEEEYERIEKFISNYTETNNKIILVGDFNGKIGNDENGITNGDTSITTNGKSTLNNIDSKILDSNDSYLTQTLLFGSTSFDSETNTLVLNATIDYILSTERFEQPLFLKNLVFFIWNLFNPFRSTFFFCIPRHLEFSVPGDCNFF